LSSLPTLWTKCLRAALACASLFASQVALAHLHDAHVPPCFEMKDEVVVPQTDTSGDNYILFRSPEFSPPNRREFSIDEYLTLQIEVSGQLCSPFYIYVLTEQSPKTTALVQLTSPSPIFPSGRFARTIKPYVTFAVDQRNPVPNAMGGVTSVRVAVVQYGSDKEIASQVFPISAQWRAPAKLDSHGFPEYECAADMQLPPAVEAPARCSNSTSAANGSVPVDLNQDGICEQIVRDAACDKTNGNRCFRILAERDGDWQPIAQFYNRLTQHRSGTPYRSLSSIETGPLSDTTRFSEWRGGAYVTHMYLHDCSRLPR